MQLNIEVVELSLGVIVKMDGRELLGIYRTKDAAIRFIEEELGYKYEIVAA